MNLHDGTSVSSLAILLNLETLCMIKHGVNVSTWPSPSQAASCTSSRRSLSPSPCLSASLCPAHSFAAEGYLHALVVGAVVHRYCSPLLLCRITFVRRCGPNIRKPPQDSVTHKCDSQQPSLVSVAAAGSQASGHLGSSGCMFTCMCMHYYMI